VEKHRTIQGAGKGWPLLRKLTKRIGRKDNISRKGLTKKVTEKGEKDEFKKSRSRGEGGFFFAGVEPSRGSSV
jgi:hypothetical protein